MKPFIVGGLDSKYTLIGLADSTNPGNRFDLQPGKPDNFVFGSLARAIASDGSTLESGDIITVVYRARSGAVEFPLEVVSRSNRVSATQLLVPNALLSLLRAADQSAAVYNQDSGELQSDQLGYSGFRVYAKTIDDVPTLANDIAEKSGVDMSAKTDDIVRIQILDHGLSRVVVIIAVVGVLGGAGSLIACLIASVERKIGQMSNYRLIGFSHFSVSLFPMVQGVCLAVLAVAVAGLFYLSFSQVIVEVLNHGSLNSGIQRNEKLMHLGLIQFLLFTLCVTVLAVACSVLAVWRTMQVDPAEALRQE